MKKNYRYVIAPYQPIRTVLFKKRIFSQSIFSKIVFGVFEKILPLSIDFCQIGMGLNRLIRFMGVSQGLQALIDKLFQFSISHAFSLVHLYQKSRNTYGDVRFTRTFVYKGQIREVRKIQNAVQLSFKVRVQDQTRSIHRKDSDLIKIRIFVRLFQIVLPNAAPYQNSVSYDDFVIQRTFAICQE